ncbi:zf-HC2 domain-containing protein [Bacteroides sp.]|uniref:zf-HC2 domain-containing protein n=1 Tax=Bacteroides sp. TaxID=29523 RepID=UPI00262C7C69|nr:zf-HC2 domain-containing protein [Bacteroides sp.]MDD3039889.1 zf-HC2 domain-containing protein [Bacteroides sp.]
MKCKEFKKNIVELCDKNTDPRLVDECMHHMEECLECKSYYEDYMATVSMLCPRYAPMAIQSKSPETKIESSAIERKSSEKQHKIQQLRIRFTQIAAALIIFVAGIMTGLSNLFSTDAKAIPSPSLIFEQAIRNVHNAGSFIINMNARTLPNENMAYFNPDAEFVNISLKVLHQNDSTFWRLEKEGGRAILFDGREQYMWDNIGLKVRGSATTGFMESFASLLEPEKLLEQQKTAIANNNKGDVKMSETDSKIVITTYTEMYDNNLYSLLHNSKLGKHKCIIENVFTKNDGLLREIRVWVEQNGKKVLILSSSEIKYNTLLRKEDLLCLPNIDKSQWVSAEEPLLKEGAHLKALQNETATEAARRILTALTNGNPEQAKEALQTYDRAELSKRLSGCKVSEFSMPKKKENNASVFVFYKLTQPDGTSQMNYVVLRQDNDQKIWILDGGL